jgi:hypothetical protein
MYFTVKKTFKFMKIIQTLIPPNPNISRKEKEW